MILRCSKCESDIEITNRTVVSPFVCDTCDSINIHTVITPEWPTQPPPDSESFVKVCDTATVENTTLLIEDLEAQIVDLEQRVADDTNYLDDFQRQIENYKNLYHEAVAERDRALEYEAWSYTTLGVKMRDFDAEKKGVNRHMAEERLKRIGAETAGSIARIRANYFIQHFNEVSSRNAVLAQDRSDLRKKVRDLRDGLYDLENLWLVKIAVRLHNYFTCGKKYYLRGFMSFPYDPNLDI